MRDRRNVNSIAYKLASDRQKATKEPVCFIYLLLGKFKEVYTVQFTMSGGYAPANGARSAPVHRTVNEDITVGVSLSSWINSILLLRLLYTTI